MSLGPRGAGELWVAWGGGAERGRFALAELLAVADPSPLVGSDVPRTPTKMPAPDEARSASLLAPERPSGLELSRGCPGAERAGGGRNISGVRLGVLSLVHAGLPSPPSALLPWVPAACQHPEAGPGATGGHEGKARHKTQLSRGGGEGGFLLGLPLPQWVAGPPGLAL